MRSDTNIKEASMRDVLTQVVTVVALTILTPLAIIGGVEVRNRMLCGEVCRPFWVESADVQEMSVLYSSVISQRVESRDVELNKKAKK